MPHPATTADLIDLLRPFVNARLEGKRDAAVDIGVPGMKIVGADVREVTDEGFTRFSYKGGETWAWADVRYVDIRAVDADGNTLNKVEYDHVPAESYVPARAA